MPRVLLFTGKGGTGKTSVAAATALRAAETGHRTLVISTDAAHSLGDVLGLPLGPEPTPVAERLDGQEIDIYYSVQRHWGRLQDYLRLLLRWRGVDEIFAEELSVLPGMEEVASYLWVYQHYNSGKYDAIVIDAAPTGETLRLLSLPDAGRWWMEKLFPIHRKVARVLRPAIQTISDIPVPREDTYDAAAELFRQLDAIHTTFTNPEVTSVRVVLNPESVVIKETLRTFTYLHLFGYAVDAVILNRLLPPEAGNAYFADMRDAQQAHRASIENSFAPVPVLAAPFFPAEVMGPASLREMAACLYGERDPLAHVYRGKTFSLEPVPDGRVRLALVLPHVDKDDVRLVQRGGELAIAVGAYRRNLDLPRALHGRPIERARMEAGSLVIVFGPR